jgi:predicted nucleotidyltransferase/predicted transcriptional regulator with HTH domain
MDIVDILFKSKIRRKILALFFADESRKFYINEMARLVDTTQGTCRRELNKLVDMGFLMTAKEGNLQFYHVNKINPLYGEFKTIIQKTIGIEALLKDSLERVTGINFAFIFGSYAKREFKPESDIDMAVVGDVKEELLMKILKNIEKTIGREINYHIYYQKEFKEKIKANSFVRNIIKDYIMVAGDEREFRKLLKAS